MKKTSQINVLVSSAGRRGALLAIFRETLAGLGLDGEVLAADMSRLSAAFHLADRSFVVPRCSDHAFIPTMLEICRANAVRLVVPTIDTELPMYAAHRADFAAIGTTVAVSAPETIAIGGDKAKTYEWLLANGLPTVRQSTPDRLLSGDDCPDDFRFPLLVKPRGGSSSIGVAVVRDEQEMIMATRGGSFIVQSIARGVEHTVDVFVDRSGKCRCAVPRRRLEVRAGEVSKAVTVRHDGMMDVARRLAEALPGAYGVLNIQMFHDAQSGRIEVIEINPRFGGGFPLAWRAGADYPRWIVQEIAGASCDAKWDGWLDRLVMLRYDDAVFVDAQKAGL